MSQPLAPRLHVMCVYAQGWGAGGGRMTWRVPESPCPCLPSEAVLQGRQPQQQHRQQLRAQQQQQLELWRRQQRQQHLQQEQLRLHT